MPQQIKLSYALLLVLAALAICFSTGKYYPRQVPDALPSAAPKQPANQTTSVDTVKHGQVLAKAKIDPNLVQAIVRQQQHYPTYGYGTVTKLLPDDNKGSRHQKFLLRIPTGQVLLIAHNIDLAPRLDALQRGDVVQFKGEYIWNHKGGVIHWTHHDPDGSHEGGYLQHQQRVYK